MKKLPVASLCFILVACGGENATQAPGSVTPSDPFAQTIESSSSGAAPYQGPTSSTGGSNEKDSYVFTVTFNANAEDATGFMADEMYYYGKMAPLKKNMFERPTCSFDSWNLAPDGSSVSYENEEPIYVMENITLYAQWDCSYTVGGCESGVVSDAADFTDVRTGVTYKTVSHCGGKRILKMDSLGLGILGYTPIKILRGYYYWSAAMDSLNTGCGIGKTCGYSGQQAQGVCPAGWHIPGKSEIIALAKSSLEVFQNSLSSFSFFWLSTENGADSTYIASRGKENFCEEITESYNQAVENNQSRCYYNGSSITSCKIEVDACANGGLVYYNGIWIESAAKNWNGTILCFEN